MKRPLVLLLLVTLLAEASVASAQGFAPRPRPGASRAPAGDKPAGPAEAAPETASGRSSDEAPLLSWPGLRSKRLLFFDLKGYFRFRADMMHNLNLGLQDVALGNRTTRAPYWLPLVERSDKLNCAARVTKAVPGGGSRSLEQSDCPDNTLSGANIRLRLEPTINVTERVRVHAQFDVFDNLVMGSTPDSMNGSRLAPNVPLAALSESQAAPVSGINTTRPAILVKRAWAEVELPLVLLKVGRMPWHWGTGMVANDGQCWDCNFGDNVDRISLQGEFGRYSFGVGYDFAGSGPTSFSVDADPSPTRSAQLTSGQAIDLEQLDDIDQLVLWAGRVDSAAAFERKAQSGRLLLNYGGLFIWRKQAFDYLVGNATSAGLGDDELSWARGLREIAAWTITPDLWIKLAWRRLRVEAEAQLTYGEVGNISGNVDGEQIVRILHYGFVVRGHYGLLRRQSLKLGLEVGGASGDGAELYDLNRQRQVSRLDASRTSKLGEFRFDPDYHVDLILFREILGTVANAVYVKPWISYALLGAIDARLDVIYSLAHTPVAYPGNSRNLGLEFDFSVRYRSEKEGFYAGLQYGLLVPFTGLDRPAAIYGAYGNAEVAQTLQAHILVKF